jgi:putative ABC transport system permease protein
MIRLCVWLLERALPDELADNVIGDLVEQRHRGRWWLLRQTVVALILLRAPQGNTGDRMVETFLGDMRLGARMLRRAPAFTTTAVLTLGLSIGATAAIFSVVNPVLLRPLPYPNPDRLAFVWERNRDGTRDNVGFQTIKDLGDRSKSIEQWAAVGGWGPTVGDAQPEVVPGDRVSWNYFRLLGVAPAIGRDFLAEEDQPNHNLEVMLSYGLWQRKFGGDSSIVGKPISIGGTPMTVVGVMPASFDNVVTTNAKIWRVLGYAASQPFACRTCHHLRMLVRLKPGIGITAASAELDGIFASLVAAYPKEYASVGAQVVRAQDEVTRNFQPALLALGGAVVLVLLIGIANVANLQLARSVKRNDEFAVRAALGASGGRVRRQLLAEGLVLAIAGGVAGAIVARLMLPLLVDQLPAALPRLDAVRFDAMGFGAIAVIVLVLALALAVAGARRDRGNLGESLRSGKRLSSAGHHFARSTFVVVEVALATMLVLSATLVGRSLILLLDVNAGFDPSHLLTLQVTAIGPRYAANTDVVRYHDRLREAIRAVPGVQSVALANQVPLAGNVDMYGVLDPDNMPSNPELVPSGDRYVASPEYFGTMRIPILHGRAYTEADAVDTVNKVVVVSAALAERMWPGQNPLGHHIKLGGPQGPTRTVIGVAGNVKHRGLDATTTLQWYGPESQWLFADNAEMVVLRTSLDPSSLVPVVRRAIATVDPTSPISSVATMDQVIEQSTAQRRLALVLFAAFAIVALLLAVAGIYGVLAGHVAERTREVGLRSALGAPPSAILRLVVSQGARLAAIGLVLGLIGSAGLTRFLRTFLFGVGENDVAARLVVVVVLGAVTLTACAIPASRALRIDASEALRGD